jgi:hypothetical protein
MKEKVAVGVHPRVGRNGVVKNAPKRFKAYSTETTVGEDPALKGCGSLVEAIEFALVEEAIRIHGRDRMQIAHAFSDHVAIEKCFGQTWKAIVLAQSRKERSTQFFLDRVSIIGDKLICVPGLALFKAEIVDYVRQE